MAKRDAVAAAAPLVPQTCDTADAGAKVRIKGERGSFKVIEKVRTDAGVEWVTLFGGLEGHAQFRNVRPDRLVWAKKGGCS